ncbi:MAG: hypothetical protein LBT00_05900 [Spirochaetaceae bacterium]|jgi:hypothetical protein|nr:hypothetical protein [Spirochaetaceae bacterium]
MQGIVGLQKELESLGIVAMETNGRLTEKVARAAIKAIKEIDAEMDAEEDARIIEEMQSKKKRDLEAVIDGR